MARNQGGRADSVEEPQLGLGARVAIGGAVAAGALVSGFLLSRRGRRLVSDTFTGRRRTPLADRVLDRFWDDTLLGRRRLDVEEREAGQVRVLGSVASEIERDSALQIAASVPGVSSVEDSLVLDPTLRRRRVRRLKERSR